MRRCLGLFPLALLLILSLAPKSYSQTANLKQIRATGMKTFTEAQVATLSGLQVGTEVGRKELQDGADVLLRSGLFSKVVYQFDTHNNDVTVTFEVAENRRLAVAYDNFPWFDDAELSEAIRKDLPFYDGALPEGGTVVDLAGNSLASFLSAHGLKAEVEHFVLANPLLDAPEQEFQIVGVTQTIASVEFSDASLASNLAVQQHLSEVRGQPYSRLKIDIFLAESIRPIYLEKGYLRAKIGPAAVRLSGNPNGKFPEAIPVYVPSTPGAVYHWKEAAWHGNKVLSADVLDRALRVNPGELANGMAIEGGWDRVREAYGQQGYLEAKVDPVASYDDQAHTVSYSVAITEGQQYRYHEMTITGMSSTGEGMIRDAWHIKAGEVMNKSIFEQFLTQLESHRDTIFKDLPVHYDTVGHWLQTNPDNGTVDALLDFK